MKPWQCCTANSPWRTATLRERLGKLGTNLLIPALILLIPWTQELIDQLFFGGSWNLPMTPRGPVLGVFTAPFSHGGLTHLLANSLMFVPLSWLVLAKSRRDYIAVWLGVLLSALPVWWFWPTASHGLSGVVYGLLGYLLVIGWLEKRPLSLLLSGIALVSYGGVLPSLIPLFSPAGVSWIGHFSGFAGGVLAAWAVQRQPDPTTSKRR
jgi:membrane associated rhomboid family serine protease